MRVGGEGRRAFGIGVPMPDSEAVEPVTPANTAFPFTGGGSTITRLDGDVEGSPGNSVVVGLHEYPIDEPAAADDGKVLTYNDNGGDPFYEWTAPLVLKVEEGDATVDAAVNSLDFGAGFDVTSSPAGEANVALDLTEIPNVWGLDSPASLGASQNNYALHATAQYIRLTASVPVNITGLVAPTTTRRLCLINIGANAISLTNLDAASAAANQIITGTGAAVVLAQDDVAELVYDTVSQKYRVL